MSYTTILQGSFLSTAAPQLITLESGVDWMRVYNFTQAAARTNAVAGEWYWQKGMAANDGLVWTYTNGGVAVNPCALTLNTCSGAVLNGFTFINTTVNAPGVTTALTAVSADAIPVVTTAVAPSTGTVVRLYNVLGAQQLGGVDFTVTNLSGTTFQLANMAQIVAGTTGNYSVIPFDPYFYPTRRTISIISKAASAVVTMTVNHGYSVGQNVRFVVPASYGMTQINGLLGVITAVTASTITVNINSTAFTTFAWPTTAQGPFALAEVIPVGEAAFQPYANNLTDGVQNNGVTAMSLGFNVTVGGPAGLAVNDVMYWTAGKSFSSN
jgi:hypothetical protein